MGVCHVENAMGVSWLKIPQRFVTWKMQVVCHAKNANGVPRTNNDFDCSHRKKYPLIISFVICLMSSWIRNELHQHRAAWSRPTLICKNITARNAVEFGTAAIKNEIWQECLQCRWTVKRGCCLDQAGRRHCHSISGPSILFIYPIEEPVRLSFPECNQEENNPVNTSNHLLSY